MELGHALHHQLNTIGIWQKAWRFVSSPTETEHTVLQPVESSAVREVEPQVGEVTQRPEVVDDFIRNFLVKMGLTKTLEMFETEW